MKSLSRCVSSACPATSSASTSSCGAAVGVSVGGGREDSARAARLLPHVVVVLLGVVLDLLDPRLLLRQLLVREGDVLAAPGAPRGSANVGMRSEAEECGVCVARATAGTTSS